MPEKSIVINTGPTIALIAATGNLNILKFLYDKVLVPYEVCLEIERGGKSFFAVKEFQNTSWLIKLENFAEIPEFLSNVLDPGEASVIQTALDNEIKNVCIDEIVGRRFARLNNLKITGSLGVLLKAKKKGYEIDIKESVSKMKSKGIWISKNLEELVLRKSHNL